MKKSLAAPAPLPPPGTCFVVRLYQNGPRYVACEGEVLKDNLCAHHFRMKNRKPCPEGTHVWNEHDDCENCGSSRLNAGADLEEMLK